MKQGKDDKGFWIEMKAELIELFFEGKNEL